MSAGTGDEYSLTYFRRRRRRVQANVFRTHGPSQRRTGLVTLKSQLGVTE
jgi:hypothetical protein